ncbi:hypothetical protein N7478_012188 [Penicillium angulare]|uniref:uncharacterized protein n=1 Tax=Penicillium angulare TaxID=116970 RepID=UPI002540C1B6|nr:uncharacterized protein N7478_012188 [Penicillium angulare]KAJ5260583.1 hypothetical protein N7478_012188 [Penicillium angulare]
MTVTKAETEFKIPVIDVSGYLQNDKESPDSKEVVAAIRSACKDPGFFQVTGHSVPAGLRDQTLKSLHEFFALPEEVKSQIHRTDENTVGYEVVGQQKVEVGDRKEGFVFGPEPFPAQFTKVKNQWLEDSACPGFNATLQQYYDEVRKLSKSMFRLLALSLDLEETYFDEFVASQESLTMCKAHRYPPTTKEMSTQTKGIGAHSDFGALTLLLQDEIGGLEVLYEPENKWYPVQYVPDAYVVNIGDMMERWTNNRYKSTKHRVISPVSGKYRFSIGIFNEGLMHQLIECIPTCIDKGEKPLHKPILAETYLRESLAATYAVGA